MGLDLASVLEVSGVSALFVILGLVALLRIVIAGQIEALPTQIDSWLEEKVQYYTENPKEFQEILKPFLSAAIKGLNLPVDEQGGMKDLRIGGFKIPGPLVAMIASQLMGNAAKGAQSGAQQAIKSLISP